MPRTASRVAAVAAALVLFANSAMGGLAVRFMGLEWDENAGELARNLGNRRFEAMKTDLKAGLWRGEFFGAPIHVEPEFDGSGRLIAITARIEPADDAPIDQYDGMVDQLRKHFGPWYVRIPAGRPVQQEHLGRFGITRTFGPRTAATIWSGADDSAAIVQMDGDGAVWVRFESPRWARVHLFDDASAGDASAR
jgi:hypothetical protein